VTAAGRQHTRGELIGGVSAGSNGRGIAAKAALDKCTAALTALQAQLEATRDVQALAAKRGGALVTVRDVLLPQRYLTLLTNCVVILVQLEESQLYC
jgi:hypothetical protein